MISVIPNPPDKPSADLGKVLYDLQTAINADVTAANSYSPTNFTLSKLLNSTLTTTGTSPAYVINTSGIVYVSAVVSGIRFRTKFHAACSGVAATITTNGVTRALKALSPYGGKINPVITANMVADIEYDGVDFVLQGAPYACGNALPKFRAEHSLSAAQTGILGFNAKKQDSSASYDGINKFTAPLVGYYAFSVTFRNGAAENYSWFLKNGTQISETVVTPANASATHQATLFLTVGDYIQYNTTAATYAALNVLKFEGAMIP